MPWHVVENSSQCSAATPHAVVKDDTGEVVGCHATVKEAEDHMAALYANEPDADEAGDTTTLATESPETQSFPGWEGTLVVEGTKTGDGRQFAENALTWSDLPLPLRWNKEDSHGGEPRTVAVNVGRIDRIWRDGTRIMASGVLNTNEVDGQRAYDLVHGKFLRGVSVDVDDIVDADVELVWPDGGAEDGEDDDDLFQMLFGSPELIIFHAGRIRAATLCDIPAFVEAEIALVQPEAMAAAGIAAEQSVVEPTTLVAHGGTTWRPNVDWFRDPHLSVPTPIVVTEDGRIYGHAALWGECHIGHPGTCVTPPYEDDYSFFMTGELICSDGSTTSVGQITLGTGHAALTLDAPHAAEHYDNTGVAVADVTTGRDAHGIWVAGVVRPGVPDARVRELRASGQLSGDWRRIGGKLRLVGLLAVNVPGFPVPKMTARVAGGRQLALVAAGRTDLAPRDLEQMGMRALADRLRARVHREG